ncbi:MAG: hypothetical protein JNM99_10640 [Verrucomicrobiaceae bacterium]|nr:hypothetical protein [Verrucomicrobiaceae bacterium]
MKTNHVSRVTWVIAILAVALVAVAVGILFNEMPSIAPDANKAVGVSSDSSVSERNNKSDSLAVRAINNTSNEALPTQVLNEQAEAALLQVALTKLGTPDSETAIIRLQLGVGADGIQRLVDRIDSDTSSNTEKELLIRVIHDARNPKALQALRSLVQAHDDFSNREPILFAAANALVVAGSEADLEPVISRLKAATPGSHDSAQFISILMSQTNPSALPYLRSLISSNAESELVRSTAVWMLVNHTDANSMALLQQLSNTTGPLQSPARETINMIQSRAAESKAAIPLTVIQ